MYNKLSTFIMAGGHSPNANCPSYIVAGTKSMLRDYKTSKDANNVHLTLEVWEVFSSLHILI